MTESGASSSVASVPGPREEGRGASQAPASPPRSPASRPSSAASAGSTAAKGSLPAAGGERGSLNGTSASSVRPDRGGRGQQGRGEGAGETERGNACPGIPSPFPAPTDPHSYTLAYKAQQGAAQEAAEVSRTVGRGLERGSHGLTGCLGGHDGGTRGFCTPANTQP